MKRQLNETVGSLRQNIEMLESEQKVFLSNRPKQLPNQTFQKQIQKCLQKSKSMLSNRSNSFTSNSRSEKLKKFKNQMEECRLKNAMTTEKFQVNKQKN